MAAQTSRAFVRPFTQCLLGVDLPGLSSWQRDQVSEFAVFHVDELPSVLRLGCNIIAIPMRGVVALPIGSNVIAWLIRHPLPLVGEYVRMIRSLAYTYVWEQWPDTLPDGSGAQ